MDRSRSKRNYYYDHHQNYDSETLARTKPRYSSSHQHHYQNSGGGSGGHHYPSSGHHRRGGAGAGGRPAKFQDSSVMVTTSYRILCHDEKAGGVIGKSGSIIKAIRQHTGAWINVHELVPGDDERIIEITDTRRRDPEGRMPSFSPAQEALFLIHERILESDSEFSMGFSGGGGGNVGNGGGQDDDNYASRGGGGGGGGGGRVVTRLVVSRMHVGCLLGKGGKIIEQMRVETKTQIRVLPRDHNLPRCVSASEEIVQVAGDSGAVKNAITAISSRLRESQHRDRGQFHGRYSPDRLYPPDDDFNSHMNNTPRRSSVEGPTFASRLSSSLTNMKTNNYSSRSFGQSIEPGAAPAVDGMKPDFCEDLVFRILCPVDKFDTVVGESDGIMDLLQNEIGVDIHVTDLVAGAEERIITISSEEGPDDELFPAQEALLHIQTRIVDLVPDEENIVTTRLLVPSTDIGCLDGRDGSLSEMRRLTGADIQILPKEVVPACIPATDELVQIVGEIKAARDALVEVTSRLRSHLYREFSQKDMLPVSVSAAVPAANAPGLETASPNNFALAVDGYTGNNSSFMTNQNVKATTQVQPPKEFGGSGNGSTKLVENERREDVPPSLNRIAVPVVTRSTLEVVIPEHAVSKLITKSKNRLSQFSELSGARVMLLEDTPEATEKIIQISGTPEQVEKAQSLLQGFILSTQEDAM